MEFQENGSHPDYCFISKDKITAAKLTKRQVLNVKNQKLNEAIKRNEFSIQYNKNRLNAELDNIKNIKLKTDILNYIKTFVKNLSETKKRDSRREKALSELKAKKRGTPTKVDIFNQTNILLPSEVEKILNMGFNGAIGSKVNQNKKLLILTQFEQFYSHFSK